MLSRSVLRFGFYAFLPLFMFLSACSGGGDSGAGSAPTASVGITLAPAKESTAQSKTGRLAPKTDNITSVTIDVTDASGNELARESTNVVPGTKATLTLNVPVGVNRIFKAEAFDEAGQVILFGNAVTDLLEGSAVTLTIPVEVPLLIRPEDSVIDTDAKETFSATRSSLLSDPLQWTVDGILNGDSEVGTITTIDDLTVEYTAPTTPPGAGQVTVRVASVDNPDLYFDETTAVINDPAKTLLVDPVNGVDSDDCGAEDAKCKTLTKALSVVEAGGTVLLERGAYVFGGTGDETLPLQMKAGVTIHGTTQAGMAFLDFTYPQLTGPGIFGADEATFSGMRIETHFSFGDVIRTNGTSPTIQDNLFFGGCDLFTDNCDSTAIFVDQSSAPNIFGNTFGEVGAPRSFFSAIHLEGQATAQIIDNNFVGNWVALLIQGDAAPRIENNRILENREGVVVEDNALPDLGGGALGSAGLNILSCNKSVDLFNKTFNEVFAQKNQWDHDPPTDGTFPGDGIDIAWSNPSGMVDGENASLYPFATCNLGVQVTAPSPNFTTEGGGSATFDVVLGTEPSADVVIDLSSSDTSEGIVSNNSLTFTNQNWNILQTVTVSGVDDAVADGNVSYQIEFDLSGSLDLAYQSESPAPIDLFNTDDETPGITVSPKSGLVTDEGGGTDTFDIVLDSAPTADVTITLNSDDTTEGLPSPSVLVFTSLNWNTAQTAMVTGQDDNVADGDVGYNIVTTVSTSDAVYTAIDADDVSVTNNDDGDVAGIRVTPASGLVTTEAGGTATFDVVLTSEPTADVDISLASSNILEGTVSTNNLTFTALNWNVAQTVTVTGVDDAVADGNILYSVNTASASSSDPDYSGMAVDDVSVTNNDDDTVGIILSRTTGLITDEGGASDSFTIVLNSQPTASVSIGLSSSDTTEGDVSTTNLSFDASNWSTPQTVTVTGVNDDIADGDVIYTIVTAAATSADTDYSGFDADDVSVSNTDDDAVDIVVTPTSALVTTEAGGSATFTVVLGSEPAADVSIGLLSNDATEGSASPASLTFTSSNWSAAQTVTVTGVDDAVDDGDQSYRIDTSASSTDTAYNAINPDDVSVSNTDDDTAGIRLNKTTVLTDEGGTTDSFALVLDSEPTANVTISLTPGDPSEGTLSSSSVVFSAGNWSVAQPVTVTGVDDAVADGNQTYTITTATASSGDPIYSAINPSDISATNNDNDIVGITVSPTSGLVTTEAGGTATFNVVLTSEPTAAVNIPLSSSNTAEGTISTNGLNFDTSNWNVPQTVTVTGIDDAVADGPVSYTIFTGGATGGDYADFDADDVSVTNNDNDTVGITVSPTAGLVTTEAGGTDTFSVVLNTQPTADVVIGLTSSVPTEGSLSTSSLTFTSGNWNVAQIVTVTGLDDALDDGDQAYTIVTAAAVSADTGYSGENADDVSASNTDDDVAGISLSRTSGLITDEGGLTDSFTVVLDSEPTANVSIGLSSTELGEGTISISSVNFTSANWNTPQTVTVTGVNDDVVDGNIVYEITTAAASSSDANYNTLNAPNVSVTNNDNDSAGIIVTPTVGLSTSEAGAGSDSFTIRLNSEPTGNVSIALSSSDLSEGTISASSLTFTAGNWSTAQTVTITGVNDDVDDGDTAYTIFTAAATSSDTNYNGFDPAEVSVNNIDDDTASINIVPTSGLVTSEDGDNASFTVVLGSEPTGDVTIGLSSNDTSEGSVSPTSLTFTASNWNALQTVIVTGVDDVFVDGSIDYRIVTATALSSDGNYSVIDPADIFLSNTDNDTAGFNITPNSGLITTEAGGSDTFTVSLRTQPSADVSIGLSSSDGTEGSVLPSSLTFTSSNWNSPQMVTVRGVDDAIADGDQNYSVVTASASSTDTNYNGRDPSDVLVTNSDDDTAGIMLSRTSGLVTDEGGASDSFTIVLNSEPRFNVTIGLSSNDTSEGNVLPASVTFTAGNWSTPQTVTATGVNDFVVDGDQLYTILMAAATSGDANYNGLDPGNVSVTNNDNDTVGITVNPTSGLVTTEAGGTDTFMVVLDTQPSANVTVRFSSSDVGEGTVSPVSLTFIASNWNVAQTVTVTGVGDAIADGDQNYMIITAAGASADTDYNGLNPLDVSVTNLDDDFRLTVNVVGDGSVTLLPGPINCGSNCIADFPSQTTVTLRTAIPNGWTFDFWSGDCSGTSSLTSILMDTDKSCTANMRRTLLLNVDFDLDDAQKPPNLDPPGDPVGDRLILNEASGTIRVQGTQTIGQNIVLLDQVPGSGGLDLRAEVAGPPPRTGRYVVRWDSAVNSRSISFASLVIRDSSGLILMNISYRLNNNMLDLNDTGTGGLPPWQLGTFQSFEVTVNLDRKEIEEILIGGQSVDVNFPLPFRESSASDLARFSFELGGTSAQSYALDSINISSAP